MAERGGKWRASNWSHVVGFVQQKGTKMGLWKCWTYEELLEFSQEVKKGFDFFTEVERNLLGAHLLALSKTSMFSPGRV